MKVNFLGQLAQAVGAQETEFELQAPLKVSEVMVILGSLYPGLLRGGGGKGSRLQIRLNGRAAQSDDEVADADSLDIDVDRRLDSAWGQ